MTNIASTWPADAQTTYAPDSVCVMCRACAACFAVELLRPCQLGEGPHAGQVRLRPLLVVLPAEGSHPAAPVTH